MSVHKHSLRSVSEMHAFLAGGGSEMPVVWGREERAEFIGEVLSAVGYERLPREAKGVVRQYLQVASGYSRAQVARTIAMHRQKGFRETVQKGVKLVIPKSVIPAGLLACFLLLMTSASFRSPEAALQFLNGDSINVWNMSKKFADSLPMDRSLLAQVSSVETVMPDGTRGDLFVVQKEVWPEGYHRLAEQHLIAETPQKLEEKVENRRETRLQNLWARLIGKDLEANTEQRRQQRLLVQDESGQIHAAAEPGVITQTMTVSGGPVNIWDLLGSGREGEVLMVKDGRPAWGSPALPTVGNPEMGAGRVPPEVSRGGGGSGGGRSYGGGNTAATATTTTTNITQNVTQTVSDSDWTASGTDIYSAVSGNVGIGTSVPSVKLEVVGTASGRIFHAQDQLTTSGALIVEEGQTIRLNGVSYLFPGSDGTSSGQVLATDASGTLSWTTQSASSSFSSGNVLTLLGSDANPRYVQIAGDTMTGALVLQGGTLTATGVNVTANLAASGTLSVDGAVTFDSTLTLNNVSYTFPYSDGTGSGKVLKTDGAGNLVWGTDANDSGIGISQNSGDARYVNVSGDTMTGALVIQGANLIASGAIITGNLAASGSLSIDGLTYLNSNTVINGNLFTRGNMSGSSLRVDGYADLWGNLSVSGAVVFDGAATFGSTLDLNGVTYTFPASDGVSSGWVLKTDSSGTLSWAPDTDTDTNTQSSTGALQTVFDNRYVRTAGDTMTGDLVLQSADLIASGATITSNLAASGSLSIDGLAYLNSNTAITGVLAVTSNISGSGTFSIEGASSLQGAVTLGSTLRINSVTYTFPYSDGTASGKVLKTDGAGQLSWATDTDTDNDTTYTAGQGLTLDGTLFTLSSSFSGSSLEISGTASGWNLHAQDRLTSSGMLIIEEGQSVRINGVTYTFPASDGVSSGWVLKTDSSGTLSWAADTDTDTNTQSSTGALQTVFDNRYVRTAGDTMTGDLVLQSANLTASGATITSNLAASGSLSIDGLAYLNANTAITGVLAVTSNISGSGVLSIEGASSLQGAVTLGSTLRINSVTYTFPYSDGAASGKILTTDGAGNLTWATDQNTGTSYIAGQGLSLDGGDAFSVNATLTGTILDFTTISGSWIKAQDLLTSSGALSIEGIARFQNASDSTTGFQILDQDGGNPVFNVDTTNERVGIGTNAPTQLLDVAGNANIGTSGYMDAILYFGGTNGAYIWAGQTTNYLGLNGYSAISFRVNGAGFGSWSDAAMTIIDGGNVGIGTTSPSTTLEVIGTASGRILHAQDRLTSSGTLSVEGAAYFGSTIELNGVEYTFPYSDGASSGKVLATDSAGQLTWKTDANTGTSYYAGQGLSLVGGDTFALNSAITGATLQVTTSLASSGALFVDGLTYLNSNTAITGVLAVTSNISGSGTLSIQGATSLQGALTINDAFTFPTTDGDNGKVLKTDGAGNLTWQIDATAGSGLGQSEADERYVKQSGDTMTGALLIVNEGAEPSLEVSGFASGWTLQALDTLASSGNLIVDGNAESRGTISGAYLTVSQNIAGSGTLSVDGLTYLNSNTAITGVLAVTSNISGSGVLSIEGASSLQGAVTLGSTLRINSVTYTFPYSDGTASGWVLKTDSSGQLSWAADTDTDTDTQSSTGALQTVFDNRYVRTAGDTMTGDLILQSADITASGATITSNLAASGSLSVDGLTFLNSNTVITGTLDTTGNITTDGNLTINEDNGGVNAVLTFGNDGGAETFTFNDSTNKFDLSDDLNITGTFSATDNISGSGVISIEGISSFQGAATFASTISLNGVTYTFPASAAGSSGKVLKSDATGTLSWATDNNDGGGYIAGQGLSLVGGDTFALNTAITGSTLHVTTSLASSGTLSVDGLTFLNSNTVITGTLDTTGNITTDGNLTINEDNGGVNAVLTFGNDSGAETFTFNDSTNEFDLSDDLNITGTLDVTDNISGSGVISIEGASSFQGAATFASTISLNGVTYTFPASAAGSSGKVLKSDATGTLSWATDNNDGGGYIAGQGLSLVGGNAFALNATLTGTLLDFATVSGSWIKAQDLLTSSGALSVEGIARFQNASDSTTGFQILDQDGGNPVLNVDTTNEWVGIGTSAPSTKLEVVGTMSGRALDIFTNDTTRDAAIFVNQDGNGTGILLDSESTTTPGLVIDMHLNNAQASPHIMLGYDGTFDVILARSGANVLTSPDQFMLTATAAFDNESILIDTEETVGTQNVFRIISDVASGEDNAFRIQANGATFSDGAYSSAGADYAEWFFTVNKNLRPGELVCIDLTRENAVKRCESAADSNLIGIVSTNPAFIGNTVGGADGVVDFIMDGIPVPGFTLVGLIGQVPAKVISEEGMNIRPGDALTAASKPGFARRAKPGEPTVGVALERLDAVEGIVNVLISRRNSSLTVEIVEEHVLKTVAAMEIEDEVQLMVSQAVDNLDAEQLVNLIATYSGSTILSQSQLEEALEMEGDSLSVRRVLKALAGLVVRDSLNVLGPANFDKLLTAAGGIMATDLTLSGGLTANGSVLFLDDLIVKGALVANSINVEHDAAIGGLLSASTLDIASGATIHGGLSVEGELLVNGKPITGADIKLNAESKIDLGQLIIHDTLFVLGDVTIEGVAKFLGDVEVVGNLSIKGEIKVASRHAGYAVIPQTGTFVTVMFDTQFSAIPIVSASPDTPVLFGVSKATATGFTIRLAGPATDEVTFSWLALTSEEPLISEGKRGDGLEIIEFPVDENGVPISTSNVWNGCIRGQAPLDSEGKPYNCSRYHDDDAWTHPDLFVEFTWNSERSPRLVLPEGYVVTPQEHPPVLSEAEGSLGEDGASPGAEDGAFPPVGSGAGLETDSGDVVNTGSGNTIPESGDDETGSGTTIPDDSETVSGEVIPDGGDDSESESEDPQETPDEENEEQPSGEESSSTEDAGDEDVAPEENNGDQITVDEESEDAGDEEIGEGGEENNE